MVDYTGIDISGKDLARTAGLLWNLPNARTVVGDARFLSSLAKGPYDVVLARHPDCEVSPEAQVEWTEIFFQVKCAMNESSRLIATCFTEPNYLSTAKAVCSSGLNLLYRGPNRFHGPYLGSCIGRCDKYVVVAKV
jgi:hypothetical protein